MKKIMSFMLLIMCLIFPSNVLVSEAHTYGVTESERQLMEEEKNKRNVFEEIDYRFTEKENKDMVDYIILAIIIVCMVIVIVLLNKKTYVVRINNTVFEDEPVKITETINEDK